MATKDKKKKGNSIAKELLSGSFLTETVVLNNLGYILFLSLLATFYIANRFHAEKIVRDISTAKREVAEMRAEALSVSADLMFASKQTQVQKLLKERGLALEELTEPPYSLVVK